MVGSKNHRKDGIEDLWDKRRTARYLGISVKTLNRWLWEHRGPRGLKVGVQVRYRRDDILAYLDSCQSVGGAEQKRRVG
jgi:hypothetical protein